MMKLGLFFIIFLVIIIVLVLFAIPSSADVNPGDLRPLYGNSICGDNPCPAWVNLTKGDMFFIHNNTVFIVVNYTCTSPSVCNATMNVTGNFSEIGENSIKTGVFKQNGTTGTDTWAIFELNGTVNFSLINDTIMMHPKNITFNATDGNTSNTYYFDSVSAPVILVNMTYPPGCPPPDQPLPPQIPLLDGTPVSISGCIEPCTGEDRAEYNGTHWNICGPTFGGDTTNFTALADAGNFSNFNLVLDIPGKAKINYTTNVSMDDPQQSQALFEFAVKNIMAGPRIGINETEWNGTDPNKPNLNLSAELTLYNVSGRFGIQGRPQIFKYAHAQPTGVICPPSTCSNFVWDGENITFEVTSFSDYGLTDAINVTLQNPYNLTYSNTLNVNFTYIPEWNSSVIMDNCTLYGNFTNGWAKNETNNTRPLVNGTINWINNTVATNGPYLWNIYCYNDSAQYDLYSINWTVIVEVKPIWSNNQSSIPSSYSPSTLSQFNITWNDELGLDEVFITIRNSTGILINNSSMDNTYGGGIYNYSIILPAGTYNWTSYANNSDNKWNSSNTWSFTIGKGATNISLWLNGTEASRSYNLYDIANFTAQVNVSGLTVNLTSDYPGWIELNNTTTVYNTTNLTSIGIFNITAYTLGNDNYSASSTTYYFDNRIPKYDNRTEVPANNSYYSPNQNYSFNITITDASIDTVIFKFYNTTNISGSVVNNTTTNPDYISINDTTRTYYVNLTDLPAGSYNYSWFVNDSIAETNSTGNLTYVVKKADGLGSLTVSPNTAVTYGTATTVTCPNHNKNAGRNEFNETLKLETDVADNPDVEVLPVATWNYYCTAPDTGNYTNVQKSIQIVVSAASSPPSSGLTTTTGISTTVTRPVIKFAAEGGKFNITMLSITTGSKMIASIARYKDIAIRAMNITVINNVGNIKIMISKLSLLPSTVSYNIDGIVYHYINIERINISDSDINTVNIEFAVNKTWLTDNNVDASNITLYRWANNQWNDLGATKINESAIEAFYNVASPGLSVFLIGTKGGAPEAAPTAAAIACVESWSCTDWSECVNQIQKRTCTDSNECGTTANKPAISQACGLEEEVAGVRTISILSNVIIIIFAVIVCVLVFLQRVRITSFFRSLPERTKKLKKTKERRKKVKVE